MMVERDLPEYLCKEFIQGISNENYFVWIKEKRDYAGI